MLMWMKKMKFFYDSYVDPCEIQEDGNEDNEETLKDSRKNRCKETIMNINEAGINYTQQGEYTT